MNLIKLSWKNFLSKPLNTFLSILLLTLGVGMVTVIMKVGGQVEGHLTRNVEGIDMVVGAKGSPLQLILSSVLHIDNPTGNINLEEALKLQKNRMVSFGIPLSYGDSHKGFRIIGTSSKYAQLYSAQLEKGIFWEAPLQVTLGAKVAQTLGLKLGDSFTSSHGLLEGGEEHNQEKYQVVGILSHSNSVIDQLILTGLESIWDVHEHGEEEEGAKEITAMLVKFKGPMGIVRMPRVINESTGMQAALPALEMNRLLSLLGVGVDALKMLGVVIMCISAISLFINLYIAMRERRFEMALMRTYGASLKQLIFLVIMEGLILTVLGFLLGTIASRLGLFTLSVVMESTYHFSLDIFSFSFEEWLLFVSCIVIGLIASLLPVLQVTRMNISETLVEG